MKYTDGGIILINKIICGDGREDNGAVNEDNEGINAFLESVGSKSNSFVNSSLFIY